MNICLIGNNLTSLILAYILSKKKFYIKIYCKKIKKNNFSTRSLGITNHNLNYLKNYFKNLSRKTHPINKIKVFIKNKKIDEEILFNQNTKTLFNMIKYKDMLSIVKTLVYKNKYISFKYLKNENVLNSLTQNNKFDLIINCEKKNLLTKKYLKNGIFKNYFNKAFTTIIKHKPINNNVATQIFTEYGPLAYLPLSKKLTSVVYSFNLKKRKIKSDDEIFNLIKKYNINYKIISNEKIENFDLKLALPKKYYYNNILFFGDTLHSIHPLAGQGFNMTIRDIIHLNELIDDKLNLGLEINKSIYEEFENNVKSNNSLFSIGIDLLHEFFIFNNDFVPKKISKHLITFINNNKKIKDIGVNVANKGKL